MMQPPLSVSLSLVICLGNFPQPPPLMDMDVDKFMQDFFNSLGAGSPAMR